MIDVTIEQVRALNEIAAVMKKRKISNPGDFSDSDVDMLKRVRDILQYFKFVSSEVYLKLI